MNLNFLFRKKKPKTVFEYLPEIYISESLEDRNMWTMKQQIKDARKGLFVLLISENENDSIDIIPTENIKMFSDKVKKRIVVGIASSETEAIELIKEISEDCFKAKGDYDLRSYLCGLLS